MKQSHHFLAFAPSADMKKPAGSAGFSLCITLLLLREPSAQPELQGAALQERLYIPVCGYRLGAQFPFIHFNLMRFLRRFCNLFACDRSE